MHIDEACAEGAIKKVRAAQIEAGMKVGGPGQTEAAKPMPTCHAAADRLLDEE